MIKMKRMLAFWLVVVLLMSGLVGFANFVSVNASSELEEDPLVPGWSKDLRLTNESKDSMHPSIAVDSNGYVHVVWQQDTEDLWGIYYKKSVDGGISWSEGRRINAPSNSGHTPSVIVDQNNVIHIVWFAGTYEEPYNEIYYKNSTDGGNTWNEDSRLTYASDDSFTPKIVAYGNTLHVVWSDKRDGNFEIYYKKSEDGGSSWSEDVRLTNDSGDSKLPSLAVDLIGQIHVAWYDKRSTSYRIYYRGSADSGNKWDNETCISQDYGLTTLIADHPEFIVDSYNSIHFFWQDGPFGSDNIFYKKRSGEGLWGPEKKIVGGDSRAAHPSPVIDSSNGLHLVWDDDRDGRDIYYKISTDCGETWDQEIKITYSTYIAWNPAVAMDLDNIIHVAWIDERDGNKEIYYKRTINPVTEPPIIVTQSLNQTTCKPGDSITVSGNAVYSDSIVPDADVTIKILETGDEWITTTDSNGDYSKTIIAPDTSGNYTVRVTITSCNHTGWKLMILTVIGTLPTAVLTSNLTSILTYENVSFCMSDSSDQDGYIVEYFLDFGDGTNISLTSAQNITHYYTDNGYYTVTLCVWDDDNLKSQTSVYIYVYNRAPNAIISANPIVVEIGSPITFDGSASYDLDGNVTQYYFDFGDGENTGWITDYSKSHLYTTSGVYTVTLKVKDNDGAVSGSNYVNVIVGQPSTPNNQLPVVDAGSDVTVYENEPVLFNGSANDIDGFIIYYQWDFDGDGGYDWNSTNTGVTTHAYTMNGTYYAELRVYDNQGGFSTDTKKIIVKKGHAQTVSISGGIVEYNNTIIIIPEGATTQNVTFTITKISTANPSGYIIIGDVCRIETDVTTFTQPMTLILSYNESNLPADISEDDLAIYKKIGNSWVKLDSTVDKTNKTVSTVVTGFSEYAILYEKPSAGVEGNGPYEIPWLYTLIMIIIVAVLISAGVGIKKKKIGKTKKNTMKIGCPSCKTMFEVEEQERPFGVKCPKCGKEGTIK